MKKLIVLVWLFLVGVACSSDDNKIENYFEPRELEMETILIGTDTDDLRLIRRENRVINDLHSWQVFVNEFTNGGLYVDNEMNYNPFVDVLENAIIDFETETVLAVVDNIGGGNTTIDIVVVTEHDDQVVVNIDRLYYGIATVISQAYHIVKVPKINKPTVFMELFDIHFR
ncbi:hypothetical protein [Flavobacterium sp. NKUCC04_CG]|uniref:hypothetical protein n=1 Tax=Flavobacterium sp. NKUCC04_CG TaxID=2842121 RepID=UPI001C5AF7BC|nr:hypothetical protein [Flavobacterium sp. NKUCC04_CG]MBW3520261.1 hypothetical protein [Flavobacterium sp. NKUCC04_CG]